MDCGQAFGNAMSGIGAWMSNLARSTDTSNTAIDDNTCPQNCQLYINNINRLTQIVKDRYYLLLADQHFLNSRHHHKKNKHPIHGSWIGHKEKYYEAQAELASAILLLPKECKQFVSVESKFWSEQPAPNQPNRPEAKEAGYPK